MFESEREKAKWTFIGIIIVMLGVIYLMFPEIPDGIKYQIYKQKNNKIKANVEKFFECEIDEMISCKWDKGEWELDGEPMNVGGYYYFHAYVGENDLLGTVDKDYKPISLSNQIDFYAEDIVKDISQIIEETTDIENYAVALTKNIEVSFRNQYSIATTYEDFLKLDYAYMHVPAFIHIYWPEDTDIQNVYKLNRELIKFSNYRGYIYAFAEDEAIGDIKEFGPILDDDDSYWVSKKITENVLIYNYNQKPRSTDLGDIEFVLDYGTENEQIVLSGYESLLGNYEDIMDDDVMSLVFKDEYINEVDDIVEKNLGHTISIVKNNHCLSKSEIVKSDISGTLKLKVKDFTDSGLVQTFYHKTRRTDRFLDLKKKGKVKKELGKIDFILNYGSEDEQKVLDGYKSISGYYITEFTDEYAIISAEDEYVKELDDIVANNIGNKITIVKNGEVIGTLEIKESYTSGTMVLYESYDDNEDSHSARIVMDDIF